MPNRQSAGRDAYHGQTAALYEEHRRGETLWQEEQRWMEQWAGSLRPECSILDLPAGTGRFVEILLRARVHLVAADISSDMLAELIRRYSPERTGLSVEKADACHLPFESNSFDYVVSWRFLHLLPPGEDVRALREMSRVCRGELVLEVFGLRGSLFAELGGLARRKFGRLFRLLPGVRRAAPEKTKPWESIKNYRHSERSLARVFTEAGLRVVARDRLSDYAGGRVDVFRLRAV